MYRCRGRTRFAALTGMAAVLCLTLSVIAQQPATAPAEEPQAVEAQELDATETQLPQADEPAEVPADEPQVDEPAEVTADEPQVDEPAEMPAEPISEMGEAMTFELHFQDTDLRGALQVIGTQGHKNIIAGKGVSGTVTVDLYGVTFYEALEAVVRATGHVYREEGNFIYVMTPQQATEQDKANRKLDVRTFRLNYVTASDVQALIAPALSDVGTISVTPSSAQGIETSKTQAGGNSYATEDLLIVRDYEENLDRVAAIITDIDSKPQQVLIEATILRATLDESNALGVDFNTLAGVDFQALGAETNGLTNLTTTAVPVGGVSPGGRIGTDFSSSVPSGGMSIGMITNEVSLFVRALESVTDTNILANPKLLVLNKQRGEVMIGARDGYLTTTVTETIATQTVEFLETGTRLVVRPFIGRDGYIRMELHPEDSSGSVNQVGDQALPREVTTEVTSNVMVRDGHTIVIGGLFRERTVNGRSQVPLLGNIPLLGTAFRGTNDQTVREEVIILLTPRIVTQDVAAAIGAQAVDDVERFRMGSRKGLQWWSRSRLAQTHMRWAREELAKGQTDKALWNLDMALSLQPRLIEAIKLKERLTQRAYWSDQARGSSVKYVLQRTIMHELGRPVEEIIPPCKPLDADDIAPEVRKAFGIEAAVESPLYGPDCRTIIPGAPTLDQQYMNDRSWAEPAAEPDDSDPDDENAQPANEAEAEASRNTDDVSADPIKAGQDSTDENSEISRAAGANEAPACRQEA